MATAATTHHHADDRHIALARQFCTIVGIVLLAAGILGFFYNSSFTSDVNDRSAVLGILDVNGWHNLVHLATGAVSLLAAGRFPRTWALVFGVTYLLVAIWGFIIGDGDSILSIIPVNTEDNILHLLLGLTGLGVYAATNPARDTAPAR